MLSPAFTVMGRSKEFFNFCLVSLLGIFHPVSEEGIFFGWTWKNANEHHVQSAKQGDGVGLI